MKKKILMLSDHALSTSGVGCQSRFLIEGLLEKGDWSIRQFGAAMKHEDYETVFVNEDYIIKPIDGFGDRNLLISAIVSEKPDVILIFTDPRFFTWLWEIADEVRKVCPIAYWHVWDNYPYPDFNTPYYEDTDLINCHSYLTYEMVSEKFPEKTNFIPHALPKNLFYELPEEEKKFCKISSIGKEREDDFVLFWINRNARRKRPADLLKAWSNFINIQKNNFKKRVPATLILHTDPRDQEGPNLYSVAEQLGIDDSVVFSTQRIGFDKINSLHNISDACINISYAEGFGLSTLESMQCGNPIIAIKTGGLTRQVVDHRDQTENGIALDVDLKSLVGSQSVPYIYEDYASIENITSAINKMFELPVDERKKLGKKAKKYVESEFSYQKTIDLWDKTLKDLIVNFREGEAKHWKMEKLG